MTSTAYDDQFTDAGEERPNGWTTREMVKMYDTGRQDERAEIAALLLKHGYRQIADAIKAGEHLLKHPLDRPRAGAYAAARGDHND